MQSTRLKGLAIAALGVLFITPDALLIKITSVDPIVFLFWRGLLLALSLCVINGFRYQTRLLPEIRRCGWKGGVCALTFALCQISFVIAMKNTSAGNVLVILNTAPVVAALMAWFIWRERLSVRTWLVILVCVAGASIMALGEWGHGDPIGLIMAGAAAITLAANLSVASSKPDSDMSVVLMFGALGMAASAALMGGAQLLSPRDAFFIALLCLFFLPLAWILIQIGPRYIPAAEVSLLLLLETILGSFLVWLFLGEVPPQLSLVGGMIVLAALVVHGWLDIRGYRAEVNVKSQVQSERQH